MHRDSVKTEQPLFCCFAPADRTFTITSLCHFVLPFSAVTAAVLHTEHPCVQFTTKKATWRVCFSCLLLPTLVFIFEEAAFLSPSRWPSTYTRGGIWFRVRMPAAPPSSFCTSNGVFQLTVMSSLFFYFFPFRAMLPTVILFPLPFCQIVLELKEEEKKNRKKITTISTQLFLLVVNCLQ